MHKSMAVLFSFFLMGAGYKSGIQIPGAVQDADGDTRILVEETPDQDKIKAFVAGALRVLYDTNHFEFRGILPGSIGGFSSGIFHVTNLSTAEFSNSVITGHSLFNGNTQGWYLGHVSSSNNDIGYINRLNGSITLSPNNTASAIFKANGKTNILGVLEVESIASILGDLTLTTQTGGDFLFTSNALRAGLDPSNFAEIGHGGSNAFFNIVGAGGIDLRFGGATLATFTSAGHLHLMTNVDQKHTLKIITANNLNDTGISWENSGGSFTHTMFRQDVGSNRADFIFAVGLNTDPDLLTSSYKIHGSVANNARFEILDAFQISSGTPGLNKVLTSDATGIATWQDASAGGWVDDGAVVRLSTSTDGVGIGVASIDASAKVQIDSTTKGFLPPRMTTAQIDAISSPATGLVAFDTDKDQLRLRKTSAWEYIHTGNVTGQFSHGVSQKPSVTTPVSLLFDTNDITLEGIAHSETVDPEEFTATVGGSNTFMLAPQWERTSSGPAQTIDFFIQKSTDGGTTFIDVANSNVKVQAGSADSNVIPLMAIIPMNVNDIVRFQMRVSSTTDGLGTVFFASEVGPPTIPATPAQILTIFHGH